MARKRVAILISGRGSNMTALIAAAAAKDFPAEIALVLSNRPDAGGLATAQSHGIPTAVVDHTTFGKNRAAFESAMQAEIERAKIELVCLAGFMRLLTPDFVNRWRDRLINIHPALLPSFRGLDTHERALADGVRIHGATVHFVVPDMDAGPIIIQGAVPVYQDDTVAALAARVLAVEHRIYPQALRLVASGQVSVDNGRCRIAGVSEKDATLIVPPAP